VNLTIGGLGDQVMGFLVQINGTTVTVPKRTSALRKIGRFIRPGWRPVTTTTNPPNNVYLSAYKNAANNQIAVVVINAATTSISLPIVIDIGNSAF
jgi:O-glycosyl hydrolase